MNEKQQLAQIRKKIDNINQQLLTLLNERAALALEVALTKQAHHKTPTYYRPERETQQLLKLIKSNPGPLPQEAITAIFREIVSANRALEAPIKITFLGPLGTFSHEAALKQFGSAIKPNPCRSIEKVFEEVSRNPSFYGIVPIENSTEGIVNPTLDALTTSSLTICAELTLQIHQNLLVKPDQKAKITRIYSHPQSLAQCRNWLKTHYPQAELIAVGSNAIAAEMVLKTKNAAAIAGKLAAETYELTIQSAEIQDNPSNMTRFWVIGHKTTPPSGTDKTSLLVQTMNQPGAFAKIMQPFAKHDVNITLFESRPQQIDNWHYVFFMDIEGHQEDHAVKHALKELTQKPLLVKILGSYPRAIG